MPDEEHTRKGSPLRPDNETRKTGRADAPTEALNPAAVPGAGAQPVQPHGGSGNPLLSSSVAVPSAISHRYQVLEELGRGGMGIVYKAEDRETGETVALKLLKPDVANDPHLQERFVNELRLARRVTHTNVCRIHDFHRVEGSACISMEFVEGENLRQVIRRFGGLPVRKGLELARQICDGLGEAHRQGIIHRDLKPENVMVDAAGNVKLMDFGIARSADSNATATGQVLGTPAYMAPEQIEGKPVDARTDIYSLGLILYEMFTGSPAFTGDTPFSVAMKNFRENPTPPRQLNATLPPPLEQIILRCLEKDPNRRYPEVDRLRSALQQMQAGTLSPTAVPSATQATKVASAPVVPIAGAIGATGKPAPRRRFAWAAMFVVLALLLLWISRRSSRLVESPEVPGPATSQLQNAAAEVSQAAPGNQPVASPPTVTGSEPAPVQPLATSRNTTLATRPTVSLPTNDQTAQPVSGTDGSSASSGSEVSNLRSNRTRGLLQRARAAMRDGRFDDARRSFNQVLRADPENRQARFLLSNLGRIEEVYRDPSKKSQLLREWGQQAKSLAEQGNTSDARRLVELILAIDPSNLQARDSLRRLRSENRTLHR